MTSFFKKKFLILCFFYLNSFSQSSNNKFYKEATKFSTNKNLKKALESINKAIDFEGDKSPDIFYFHKYEYLVKLEKFSLAFKTLNDALNLFPNSILLLNARAEFYFALKKYKFTIADYEKIIANTKKDKRLDYYIKLANIKFLIRDFEGVSSLLKLILKTDPSNINGLNLLATLYIELQNNTKAREILETIINNHSSNIIAIINLGFTYQKEHKYKKALFYFNRALKISPNNPIALSNRAYSKLKLNNIQEALVDIQKSLGVLPTNSYAYMIRGKIYLESKEFKKACIDFNISKNLNFSEQYGFEIENLLKKNCYGKISHY